MEDDRKFGFGKDVDWSFRCTRSGSHFEVAMACKRLGKRVSAAIQHV